MFLFFEVMTYSSKKTTEATCLRGLAISHLCGVRVPIDVDPYIGRA